MNATKQLQVFVGQQFGEERWEDFCNMIESVGAMYEKKLVGEQFVEQNCMAKIVDLISGLSNEQIEYLKNLLERDAAIKGILLDAVTKAREVRKKA